MIENVSDDKEKITKPNINITPIQGRNEKCKCGSGKKFKVCCGNVTNGNWNRIERYRFVENKLVMPAQEKKKIVDSIVKSNESSRYPSKTAPLLAALVMANAFGYQNRK